MSKSHDQIVKEIAERWHARASSQNLKPNTVKRSRAEIEFAMGAMAALQAVYGTGEKDERMVPEVPPIWIINIMSGRPVFATPKEVA